MASALVFTGRFTRRRIYSAAHAMVKTSSIAVARLMRLGVLISGLSLPWIATE
jgi:hypothetical protein